MRQAHRAPADHRPRDGYLLRRAACCYPAMGHAGTPLGFGSTRKSNHQGVRTP